MKTRNDDVETDPVLNSIVNIPLKVIELNIIYNVLGNKEYRPGDGELVMGIFRKIKPYLSFDTNITPESAREQLKEAQLKAGRPEVPKITITKRDN